MKANIFLLLLPGLFMALQQTSMAQSRIGIVAGYNMTSANIVPTEYTAPKEGYMIGLFYDLALGKNVAWNTTGVYSQRGVMLGDDIDLALNYLEADTRLKLLLGDRSFQLYVMAGPRFGVLAEAVGRVPGLGSGDVSELFQAYDLGYSAGGGLRLGPIFFELTYSGSLMNISADYRFSMKNEGLQFASGLSIPLGF